MPSKEVMPDIFRFCEAADSFALAHLLADKMCVSPSHLAQLTGAAPDALKKAPYEGEIDAALALIVQILNVAAVLTGEEGRAVAWFKYQPLPGWAGKTAYDLVQEGKPDAVLMYLEQVYEGVYA